MSNDKVQEKSFLDSTNWKLATEQTNRPFDPNKNPKSETQISKKIPSHTEQDQPNQTYKQKPITY